MNATVRPMPLYYSELHQLLDEYGVHTIRQLRQDTGLSSQQCWNLWHGQVGVGRKTALLLERTYGIPLDRLMRLAPVPKPKPQESSATGEEGATAVPTQVRGPHPTPAPAPEAVEPLPLMPTPQQRKAEIVARLRDLQAQRLSLQAIANQLNAEGVPTLSGKGTWKKGTIGNLLAEVGS